MGASPAVSADETRSASLPLGGRTELFSAFPADSVWGQRKAPTTAAHIPAPKPASIIRRLGERTRKLEVEGVLMGRVVWD